MTINKYQNIDIFYEKSLKRDEIKRNEKVIEKNEDLVNDLSKIERIKRQILENTYQINIQRTSNKIIDFLI